MSQLHDIFWWYTHKIMVCGIWLQCKWKEEQCTHKANRFSCFFFSLPLPFFGGGSSDKRQRPLLKPCGLSVSVTVSHFYFLSQLSILGCHYAQEQHDCGLSSFYFNYFNTACLEQVLSTYLSRQVTTLLGGIGDSTQSGWHYVPLWNNSHLKAQSTKNDCSLRKGEINQTRNLWQTPRVDNGSNNPPSSYL